MSAPLASCALYVAGQRIADTADKVGAAPTALAGLSVQWGRSDALSQPSAATAQARLVLPPNPGRLTDMLTIGRNVSVMADIPTWSEGTATKVNLAHAYSVDGNWDGTHLVSTQAATLILPPAQPTKTVGAWDHLPTAVPGQVWKLAVTLRLPTQPARVSLHPVTWTSPVAVPSIGPAITSSTVAGTATISTTFSPTTAHRGTWIGMAVRLWPAGPSWAQASGAWAANSTTWRQNGELTVIGATLTPPKAGAPLTANVFQGAITDTSLEWDRDLGAPVLTLTAADLRAHLASLLIGDEPWPEHTMSQRVAKILDVAGLPIPVQIDPLPGSRHLAPRDVDAQSVDDLLTEAAQSTGAVLWATSHRTTGPYLRLEDPGARQALSRLHIPPTGDATVQATTRDGLALSAHHLHADVTLTRTVADAITSVRLTWQEPGVADNGVDPTLTQRTITITDTKAEQLTGAREVSVSTSLSRQDEALSLATRLARLTTSAGWRLERLTWDTAAPASRASLASLAALLDATRRMGAPVRITDLPDWLPGAPIKTAYVDGGTITWDEKRPRWVLDLTLTSATTDGDGLTWTDIPTALTWQRAGEITWAHTSAIAP